MDDERPLRAIAQYSGASPAKDRLLNSPWRLAFRPSSQGRRKLSLRASCEGNSLLARLSRGSCASLQILLGHTVVSWNRTV
jgi:hypothetical protein